MGDTWHQDDVSIRVAWRDVAATWQVTWQVDDVAQLHWLVDDE
jgi:hypothetical protein